MNAESELSWEQARTLADTLVLNQTGKHLSDIEIEVLHGAWDGKSYESIAEELFRSVSYINKDVGYRLWKKLSEALGEEVTKKNFRQAFKRRQTIPATSALEFPDGPMGLNSPFYVERASIEADCYREILKPGSLIRIRGPRQMGKTSLLNRILAYAAQQNYRTVRMNLRQADKTVFVSLNRFLRWFCLNVSRQLNLEPRLDDYWDEEIGSKVSCTGYFQAYLLEQLDTNLVIDLDEIDTVFKYPDIAEDFLALLREWHEEAMINESWQKLRLAIAHSTEVYVSLNIHQSPFNVGLPLRLPSLTSPEVEALAQVHGLSWRPEQTEQLMAMVGGHPYLIRLALYHLARQDTTFPQLLQDAATHAGIYRDHLRRCLEQVKHQSALAIALRQVVAAQTILQLESVTVYQLDSMGLIHLNGNQVMLSCELYCQYFANNL
jgi:hypothetical protein